MVKGCFRRVGGYGSGAQVLALLLGWACVASCSGKTISTPGGQTARGSDSGGSTSSPDDPPSNDGGSFVAMAGTGSGGASGGSVGKISPGSAAGAGGARPVAGAGGVGGAQGDCATQCGATQACNDGVCGAKPQLVTEIEAGCDVASLALSGSRLYYTDSANGTVGSVTLNGQAPVSLATGQSQPTQIAVSHSAAYWIARGANAITRVGTSGGLPQTVATNADGINGFAIDDSGSLLYFSSGTNILRTPTTGGEAPTLVGKEESGYPMGLAIWGKQLAMPVDINGDVDVMQLAEGDISVCASEDSVVKNHNCTRPARSQGSLLLNHIELIGDQIYWVNQVALLTSSASKPLGFNNTITQASSPIATTITAFTIYVDRVFFADDSGTIYRAPLMNDSTPKVVARGQGRVNAIASDGSSIYWIVPGCSILSLKVD